MPEGSILEARFEGVHTGTGKRIIQVHHWEQAGDDGADIYVDMQEAAEVLLTRWVTNVAPLLPTIYAFIATGCQIVHPTRTVSARVLPEAAETGDIAGAYLPGDVALVSSMRTNFPGRSGIGRNYWGPLAEANTTGELFSEAHAEAWATALGVIFGTTVVTNTSGTIFRSGVFSPTRAAVPIAPFFFALRNIEIDSVTRNMTRRGNLPRLPVAQ